LLGATKAGALHYLLPVYPLLAALGTAFLVRTLSRPSWAAVLFAGLTILPTGAYVALTNIEDPGEDSRVVARRWVETHIPSNEQIGLAFFWSGSCNPPVLANGPQVWTIAKTYVDKSFMARLPAGLSQRLQSYFASRPVYRIVFLEEYSSPAELRAAGVRYTVVSSCAYAPYIDRPPPPEGATWSDRYTKVRGLYAALLAQTPDIRVLAEFTPAQGYKGPHIRVLDLSPGTR